jgi:hypothetical protein
MLAGCDPDGFERSSEVSRLRTLAIGFEPPEFGPGDVLHVRSLTVRPPEATTGGDTEGIEWTWELCLFAQGPDERFQCATIDGEVAGFEVSREPEFSIPWSALEGVVGNVESLCEALTGIEVPRFVQLPDCSRGLPVTLRLTVRDGETEQVSRRQLLLLRDEDAARPDRNRNPQILGLLAGGSLQVGDDRGVLRLREPGGSRFQLLVDLEDAERWQPPDPDVEDGRLPERREVLNATWFSSRGLFEFETTWWAEGITSDLELSTNRLRLRAGRNPAEVGDEVQIWVVLRDDRGGTDWRTWRFVVGEGSMQD